MKTNEKVLKRILFILIAILVIMANSYIVKATGGETSGVSLSDMEEQAKSFINQGKEQAQKSKIDPAAIAGEFVGLGQILTMVGAGVLVAVTTYMGIKYLTSGPEAQAKLKVQLIGIIVSGMVIFGAYTIWSIVVDIASQF